LKAIAMIDFFHHFLDQASITKGAPNDAHFRPT